MSPFTPDPTGSGEPIVYDDLGVTVHHGDCLNVLRTLPDASVDAIVTDPPYGLGFMGKGWDALPPGEDWARECLRVLKPGGHLLAFGGSRTWHRLMVAVEDAGFEIRDSIAWLYGSGFPKSLDVSKAIDKARDDRADILRVTSAMADAADALGVTRAAVDAHMGTSDMGDWWLSRLHHRCQCPKWDQWLQLKELLGIGDELDAEVWRLNGRKGTPGEAWGQREVIGERTTGVGTGRGSVAYIGDSENRDITAPATPAAQQWAGWGTALKPGFEPIVVARKPLAGTVAANVLAHGTGALNIDGCRVPATDKAKFPVGYSKGLGGDTYSQDEYTRGMVAQREDPSPGGRWPTNVVLDGDTADALDAESGMTRSATVGHPRRSALGMMNDDGWEHTPAPKPEYGDFGGASRFFPTFRYQAKAPARERPAYTTADGRKVAHPTVKPLALMRWLVKLVTPPNGVVLDTFAGSGSTLEAAARENVRGIGIEQLADYIPLIRIRLDALTSSRAVNPPATVEAPSLFDLFTGEAS